ncbi:MAG: FKBP-type peptidyl-prolyl cis-trans isomerase [Bacteroidota bacterium]
MKKYLWGLACLLLLAACKEQEDQDVIDEGIIQEYITNNGLDAVATGTGLYHVIQDTGLSGRPDLTSTVRAYYTGRLTDGTVFDEAQSPNTPLEIPLANLIPGWQEGLQLIGKNGRQTLLIPSALGYGSRAVGSIPSNSVLVFDIELLDYF